MASFLFTYPSDPACPVGYRVEAATLQQAKNLLYLHSVLDDPFGWMVTPQNIEDNFTTVNSVKQEKDVNVALIGWGFTWLVRMQQ